MSSVHEGAQEPVDPQVLDLGRANGWLRGSGETPRIDKEYDRMSGVTAYADQVDFIPGVTRTKAEIAAAAEELYGPAYDPGA